MEVWSLEIQSGATLTLLTGARLVADDLKIWGNCNGCESRVLLEGLAEPVLPNIEKLFFQYFFNLKTQPMQDSVDVKNFFVVASK